MNVEQLVESELTGQTAVFTEALPHFHFAYHKTYMT
jgi:hypothetical protein